jgi:hypothetical protein
MGSIISEDGKLLQDYRQDEMMSLLHVHFCWGADGMIHGLIESSPEFHAFMGSDEDLVKLRRDMFPLIDEAFKHVGKTLQGLTCERILNDLKKNSRPDA